MLDVDFFADARAYIENREDEAEAQSKPASMPIATQADKDNLPPVIQGLEIAEDCKTFTYKTNVYNIPDFYNKEMIRQKDSKTLDIIFKGLGLVY